MKYKKSEWSNFLDLQESVEPSCDLCAFYFFVCKDNIESTYTNLDEFDFKWEHSGRSWFSFSLFWDHYRTAMAHMMLFEQGCHSHYFSNVPYSCRLKRLMGLLRLRQELDVGSWTSRVPLRTYQRSAFYVRDPFQNSFGGTSASLPRTVQISALWRVWVTLHLYTTVPLHFSPRQNLCRLCNPCTRCNPCNLLANLLPLTPRETRTET